MLRVAAFIGTVLFCVVFTENDAGRAFAQQAGNIEDRLSGIQLQIPKTDQDGNVETTPPQSSSGLINISVPPSDIENRLPPEEPSLQNQNNAEKYDLPPPPALREHPTSRFVLTAVEISGVTAFPLETFAPLYDGMLARTITVKDVARITEAITAAYRAEGYFLSRATAPAQTANNGVLRINVSEGYLASVTLQGGNATLRGRLRSLTEERPLRLSSMERTLAVVGDLKGVSVVSTQITPDPVDLARHELNVVVKLDDFEAALFADNRGTDAAGPLQLYVRGAANSLLRTGDQFSIGFFTTPTDPHELSLAELSYQLPLHNSGTYATLSGMISHFDAGASLAVVDVETHSTQLSFSLSQPIIRKQKTSLWANIGIEGRNIEEERLGAPVLEDKLRVLSAWTNFRKEHGNGYTTVFGKVSRGLDMLGATIDETSLSRPDANGEFTKFEAQISRYQNIGNSFGIYTSLAGQSSLDPLLASEEFSLGGARFGRAYDYGELTGDDGAALLIELRYGREPSLEFLDFYQFYGFYDYGVVWNDNAAPGFEKMSLSSVGGGLRLTFPNSLLVSVELAKPIDETPFTQTRDDWRGFFSITKNF